MEHNIRILIGLTNAKFEIEKKSIPHFCHTAKAEEKFELIFILNVEILSKFADIVKTHQGKLPSLHVIVIILTEWEFENERRTDGPTSYKRHTTY